MRRFFILIFTLVFTAASHAQPAGGAPLRIPAVDPAIELKGAALADALRKGGYVLYVRHTETGTVTETCGASNLTPNGEADARTIGAAIKALKLPIGAVFSSEHCRCVDTAKLIDAGPVVTTEDLYNMNKRPDHGVHAARIKRLATPPAAGSNTLLVSHLHGGTKEAEQLYLELGETVVYRPDGKGGSAAVARLRVDDWAALLSLKR